MPKDRKVFDLDEWDSLVKRTYQRPYSLQQQDGCMEKGKSIYLTIPDTASDYENDVIQNDLLGDEMGVSFKAWLERDPRVWKGSPRYNRDMFWERNFYPDIQMIANDLHQRGLVEAGDYLIDINW